MNAGTLFSWLAPPLLGAAIGYFTNVVAIRMLFRPLRPWRIGKLRLPLTPGIIPAKRHQLADKMGKMVGEHLLTPDAIHTALQQKVFQQTLREAVRGQLEQALRLPLDDLEHRLTPEQRQRIKELLAVFNQELTRSLFSFLASQEFHGRLCAFLREKEQTLLRHDLQSLLDPQTLDRLQQALHARLDDLLFSDNFGDLLQEQIQVRLDRLLTSDTPLREVLPPQLVSLLLAALAQQAPQLLATVDRHLSRPELRRAVSLRIQRSIKDFIESLQGVSGFFAGFVKLNKINAKVPAFLDQMHRDLSQWLHQDETRDKILHLLEERFHAWLELSPAQFLPHLPYEQIAQLRSQLVQQVLTLSRGAQGRNYLHNALQGFLNQAQTTPLNTLLKQILDQKEWDRFREQTTDALISGLQSSQAREIFTSLLLENGEQWLLRQTTGQLGDFVPLTLRDWLEERACSYGEKILQEEIPTIISGFNVRQMVTDKVDSLDILAVEGLLLGVMQEHFLYINLFGGLLGFFIGLLNLWL
jgi:uncharacterized membrane protein YheB (UPF0754 family)